MSKNFSSDDENESIIITRSKKRLRSNNVISTEPRKRCKKVSEKNEKNEKLAKPVDMDQTQLIIASLNNISQGFEKLNNTLLIINENIQSQEPESESEIYSESESMSEDEVGEVNISGSKKKFRELILRTMLKSLKQRYSENDGYDEEDEEEDEEEDLICNSSSNEENKYKKYISKLGKDKREELINLEKIIRKLNGPNDTPLKYKILTSGMNDSLKLQCIQKLEQLDEMGPFDHDYIKLKEWLIGLCNIPFGVYKSLPINPQDSSKNINHYLTNVKNHLDKTVYGMEETKENILQILGQWITNPDSISNPISIQGPPGTGKTTLVREGIAVALGRPFYQINLGGFKDSSNLIGHDYTYIGSKCGALVNTLIKAKCMNPIIYFDELDKIPENPYGGGQEIVGVLTHLVDTSQNSVIQDKYYSGIDFDFSKSLFIFSYNDEKKVDYILNDRLLTINTLGYKINEKYNIAKNYLIPSLLKNVGLKNDDIIFTEEVIHHIIQEFTNKEEGVRNLKRCLDIIILKLNLLRLINFDTHKMQPNEETSLTNPQMVISDINNTKKLKSAKLKKNKKQVENMISENIDTDCLTKLNKLGIKIKFPFKLEIGMISKLLTSNNKNDIPHFMYL